MRVAVGEGPWCVATAELNAGHRAYLVVTNIKSNTVSILENDGSGHFAKVGDYAAGSGPLWVASTDLDGDGLADLAVAVAGKDSNSQLAILWNQGGRNVQPSGLRRIPHSPRRRGAGHGGRGRRLGG